MNRSLACLIVLLLLAGCGGPAGKLVKQYGGEKTRPDALPSRSIVLVHPQSGETFDQIYYQNGAYDPAAMKKINRLFRDRTLGKTYPIDPELIDFLVDIRTRLCLPPSVVFEILSGYRARETNERLRDSNGQVAKESFHMRGWAVDFRIRGVQGRAAAEIAKTMQRGGVSYYPSSNHLHVDLGNIRTWAAK